MNFFVFLWVISALLSPDPNTDPGTPLNPDPDSQHCQNELRSESSHSNENESSDSGWILTRFCLLWTGPGFLLNPPHLIGNWRHLRHLDRRHWGHFSRRWHRDLDRRHRGLFQSCHESRQAVRRQASQVAQADTVILVLLLFLLSPPRFAAVGFAAVGFAAAKFTAAGFTAAAAAFATSRFLPVFFLSFFLLLLWLQIEWNIINQCCGYRTVQDADPDLNTAFRSDADPAS